MTETENPPPHTNGIPDDGLDDEDRTKIRPADIDADVREMERRKRVEMIMNSRLFREELERIIEIQMKDGSGSATLLQSISDMMGLQGQRLQSAHLFRSSNCVVPINDIRGVESMGYAKGEKILRCKVAAVYRLMDLYGWTQNIQNHITARLNVDEEIFLVNPHGLLYNEITASSLVKVDMRGDIIEPGTTNFGVNTATFSVHAAIHAARPDLKAIIHVATPAVVAVSSLKCGLLPLSRESVVLGELSTHPFTGYSRGDEEKERIVRNLGPNNKVLFLSNNGAVCCGETVEEAFYNVYNLVAACEAQLKLMPAGLDNLVLIPEDVRKEIYDSSRVCPEGAIPAGTNSPTPAVLEKKEKRWRIGGMEFEALMRMLDNAGFRTGYIYRTPLIKGDPPRPRNDVEVPPAVSSLGYLLEEEEMYRNGWKGRKSNDRTRWLNSPNVYQKVEILETGTSDPKKITKWVEANSDAEWVADGSPTHSSTPVKIDSALQFVPKNTNPKEFKKLQQQIKENRRADKITSGPQSQLLEGVSWEEAKKLQDANQSATGDQVILVGAASKGIIQRGFQHNATVYKTPYAKNPFDQMTDQEIEEYKSTVSRKQRGEFSYDDSESEALSSSAALPPRAGTKPPVSETDDESRDEPRVLRINTKQVPKASQPEVVLSDDCGTGVMETRHSGLLVPRSKEPSLSCNSTPSFSYNSLCSMSYNSTPSLYYNSTPPTFSYESRKVEQAKLVQVRSYSLPERKKVIFVTVGNKDVQKTAPTSPESIESHLRASTSNVVIRRRNSEIMKKKYNFMTAKPLPVATKRKSDAKTIKSIINNLLLLFQDVKYSQSLRFPRRSDHHVCPSPCSFVYPPSKCIYRQASDMCPVQHQSLNQCTTITHSDVKDNAQPRSSTSSNTSCEHTGPNHTLTESTQTYEQPFAKSSIHSRQLLTLESPYKRMFEKVLSEMKDKNENSEPVQQVCGGGDAAQKDKPHAIPETPNMALLNLNSDSKELLMKSIRKLNFDIPLDDEPKSAFSPKETNTKSSCKLFTNSKMSPQDSAPMPLQSPKFGDDKKSFLEELKSKLLSPNKGLNRSPESSPMKKYTVAPEIKRYLDTKCSVINISTCNDEISTSFNSPVSDEPSPPIVSSFSEPLSVYIPPEKHVINNSPPVMIIPQNIRYTLPNNYLSPIYEASTEETCISEQFIRKIDKYTYNHVHSSGSIDDISSVECSQQISINEINADHSVPERDSFEENEKILSDDFDEKANADPSEPTTTQFIDEASSKASTFQQGNQEFPASEMGRETLSSSLENQAVEIKHEEHEYNVENTSVEINHEKMISNLEECEELDFQDPEIDNDSVFNMRVAALDLKHPPESSLENPALDVKHEDGVSSMGVPAVEIKLEESISKSEGRELQLESEDLKAPDLQLGENIVRGTKTTGSERNCTTTCASTLPLTYSKQRRLDKCPSFINIEIPSSKMKNIKNRTPQLNARENKTPVKESKSCQRLINRNEFKDKAKRSLDSLPREVTSKRICCQRSTSVESSSNQPSKIKQTCNSREKSSSKEKDRIMRARSNSPSPRNGKCQSSSRRTLFDNKTNNTGKKFERQCCKKTDIAKRQDELRDPKKKPVVKGQRPDCQKALEKNTKCQLDNTPPTQEVSKIDQEDIKSKPVVLDIITSDHLKPSDTSEPDSIPNSLVDSLEEPYVSALKMVPHDIPVHTGCYTPVEERFEKSEINLTPSKNLNEETVDIQSILGNEDVSSDDKISGNLPNIVEEIVELGVLDSTIDIADSDSESATDKSTGSDDEDIRALLENMNLRKNSQQGISHQEELEEEKVVNNDIEEGIVEDETNHETYDTQYVTIDITAFDREPISEEYDTDEDDLLAILGNMNIDRKDPHEKPSYQENDTERKKVDNDLEEKEGTKQSTDESQCITLDTSISSPKDIPEDSDESFQNEEYSAANEVPNTPGNDSLPPDEEIKDVLEYILKQIDNERNSSSVDIVDSEASTESFHSEAEIDRLFMERMISDSYYRETPNEEGRGVEENYVAEETEGENNISDDETTSNRQYVTSDISGFSQNNTLQDEKNVTLEDFRGVQGQEVECNVQDEVKTREDFDTDTELQKEVFEDIAKLTPEHQESKTNPFEFSNDSENNKSSCSYFTCQDESFQEVLPLSSPYQLCFFNKKDEDLFQGKRDSDPDPTQVVGHSTQLEKSSASCQNLRLSFDNISSIQGDFQPATSSCFIEPQQIDHSNSSRLATYLVGTNPFEHCFNADEVNIAHNKEEHLESNYGNVCSYARVNSEEKRSDLADQVSQENFEQLEKVCEAGHNEEEDEAPYLLHQGQEEYQQHQSVSELTQHDFDGTFEFDETDLDGNNYSSILFEQVVSFKSSPSIVDVMKELAIDNNNIHEEQIDNVASIQFENDSCEREFNLMIEKEFVQYMKLNRSLDSVVEQSRLMMEITGLSMKRLTI